MWPNRVADGSTRTTTPGIVSDVKELELEEHNGVLLPASSEEQTGQQSNNNTGSSLHHSASAPVVDEFPILDELDRLAKMSKYHYDGHMIKQDWLDRLTLKEIQNATKKEKFNSKFFFMAIEFAQIKCEDVKYKVLYYEEVRYLYQLFYHIYIFLSIILFGCSFYVLFIIVISYISYLIKKMNDQIVS